MSNTTTTNDAARDAGQTFRLEAAANGKVLLARTEAGEVLARWTHIELRRERGDGYYDQHRLSKGDRVEVTDRFVAEGRRAEVIAACARGLPEALRAVEWEKMLEYSDNQIWCEARFLAGLLPTASPGWGNTPAKAREAAKRAVKKGLVFAL